MDKHFLTRFAANLRDVMNPALETSIVMRNVHHELGSSLDAVFKREAEIAAGRAADASLYAKRNLCQLHRYHSILENAQNLFIRKAADAYSFRIRDLKRVLEDVYNAFDGDAEMESRSVELRPAQLLGDTFLEVDSGMLRVALFNLTHNAVKYSFRNHYVDVQGRERRRPNGRCYELQICNYGVGILREEIEHRLIFLERYSGALSRDMNRTGSGLGLAIAERIIRNHNGEILVRSISQDEFDRRKSEYGGRVDDPSLRVRPDWVLEAGALNIFTILLPFRV